MSSFATKIVVCVAAKNRPEFLKNASLLWEAK